MKKTALLIIFTLVSSIAFAGETEIASFNCNGLGNISQSNDPMDDIKINFTVNISNIVYPSGNSELYFKVGGNFSYLKKGGGASWGMVNTSGGFDDQTLNVRGYMYYAKKNDFLNAKYSEEQAKYIGAYYNELDGQHFTFSCLKQ